MRLNKWIVAGLCAVGLVITWVQHASAYSVSDLYGTWTGTATYQTSPVPTEMTSAGISDYPTPAGYYDPRSATFTFSASSGFAFAADTVGLTMGSDFTAPQIGADVDGNTFTWQDDISLGLTGGGTVDVAEFDYTGTIAADSMNSALLQLTGTLSTKFLIDELPSSAPDVSVNIGDADFSLTKAIPTGPSTVPLPSAAWSILAMLGSLVAIRAARSRLRDLQG
jgi:hypothetical protein